MNQQTPPFGNPNPNQAIPDVTLPRVGFPTQRPYNIEVNIEDANDYVPPKHPWRVLPSKEEKDGSGNPISMTWEYVGGTVYTCGQGDDIEIEDGTIEGDVGYALLHTTRDSSTREVVAAEVIFSSEVTVSDYTDQYRVLAYMDTEASPRVRQEQFEEIRLYEELVVENGSFILQGYEISHRNNYEPPI
jgi:hypothetical protein